MANPDDLISIRYLLGCGSQDYRKNQYDKIVAASIAKGVSIKKYLDDLLTEKETLAGVKTIVQEYGKVLSDVNGLKAKIIESATDAFQSFFIKSDADEEDFYELNQIYATAVKETELDELNHEEGFNKWMKSFFACFQELIVMPEIPENIDHIRIMSLHASKGLSAKFVILASMIDNLMPFIKSGLTRDEGFIQIEEQRRLFYVAITRCKASDSYPGQLIISSFLSMKGVEAARMGIPASPRADFRTRSTRFLNDFGQTSPTPINGSNLI
jgi:superfamily I DNA/RNA helicase